MIVGDEFVRFARLTACKFVASASVSRLLLRRLLTRRELPAVGSECILITEFKYHVCACCQAEVHYVYHRRVFSLVCLYRSKHDYSWSYNIQGGLISGNPTQSLAVITSWAMHRTSRHE